MLEPDTSLVQLPHFVVRNQSVSSNPAVWGMCLVHAAPHCHHSCCGSHSVSPPHPHPGYQTQQHPLVGGKRWLPKDAHVAIPQNCEDVHNTWQRRIKVAHGIQVVNQGDYPGPSRWASVTRGAGGGRRVHVRVWWHGFTGHCRL